MELVYTGKTKDIYAQDDGTYALKFKDDLTGENGVFDPGANTVGLSISGAGLAGLKMTAYYMQLFNAKGIKTHFLSADLEEGIMTVLPASLFGEGIEVICRFRAVGSFIRRYGSYIKEGDSLPSYVEITLKDDERGDPLINKDALAALHILSPEEHDILVEMMVNAATIIRDDLAEKGMELYDVKLEFGRVNGEIHIIDEVSGGSMRVFKDGVSLDPLALSALVIGL